MSKLRIAVSQFPVSIDIKKNYSYIKKHVIKAAGKNADIVHFPETALSGYESDINKLNWDVIDNYLDELKNLAENYNIYIIIGSHLRQEGKNPFNALHLISNKGKILGSYIKNHLYGNEFNCFDSKQNMLVINIKDIPCGFLICYDSCFPAIFNEYRKKGVKIIFLSYYNANNGQTKNSLDNLIKAQLSTRAADNIFYISGSNSSSKYSRIPSCVAYPDGEIKALKRHVPDVLIFNYPSASIGWTYDNSIE